MNTYTTGLPSAFPQPSFTQTQMAAYDRYIMLMNLRELRSLGANLDDSDDQFHEDVARCYFRAAGIPDELKENKKFMEWWEEGE